MLAGELYLASDPELTQARLRAGRLFARFNATPPDADELRYEILTELFGSIGAGCVVNPSLKCDYGFNIHLGRNCFVNYDCVVLDCNRVDIGDDVQIGPGVHIYTATHPLDIATRKLGYESAKPVRIGSGVWIGGGSIICPGVTIGENTVIGAGSVVVRDLPSNALAVGNPCKVIRSIDAGG